MSRDDIILFLHIPKTAGSTLASNIYDQYATEEYYKAEDGYLHAGVYYFPGNVGFFKPNNYVIPPDVKRALSRSDLRAVVGHFWYGIHQYISLPVSYITVLRDPVERVLSLYYHLYRNNEISLDDFLMSPPYKEVDNDQTRRISGVDPPVGACTSQMLQQAKQILSAQFAAVGILERFDETLNVFKNKLGWTKPVYDYQIGNNPQRKQTNELPESTIAAARFRNQLDYELYEYANSLLSDAQH